MDDDVDVGDDDDDDDPYPLWLKFGYVLRFKIPGAELDPWRSFRMKMAFQGIFDGFQGIFDGFERLSWFQGIFDGFQPYLKVSALVAIALIVYDRKRVKRLEDRLYDLEQWQYTWDTFVREMWNSQERLRFILHPNRIRELTEEDVKGADDVGGQQIMMMLGKALLAAAVRESHRNKQDDVVPSTDGSG